MRPTHDARRRSEALGYALLAAILVPALPAAATEARLCFNTLRGVPVPDGHGSFVYSGPPTIDGVIEAAEDKVGDVGWRGAFEYQYINGTTNANGTMNADGIFITGTAGGNQYFGWEVKNASGYSNADKIVLAFQDAEKRLIRFDISPVCDGVGVTTTCDMNGNPVCSSGGPTQACPANNKPWQVLFSTGSNNNDDTVSVTWKQQPMPPELQASLKIAARSTGTGQPNTSNAWAVELQIPSLLQSGGGEFPTTIYDLTGADQLRVYTDAFRVDTTAMPPQPVNELFWPPDPRNEMVSQYSNTPPVHGPAGYWGSATNGGNCPGVTVTNIYSNGTYTSGNVTMPDPSAINYDRCDMKLTAQLSNSGDTDATHVMVNFRIANFGFNGETSAQWKEVPIPTPGSSCDAGYDAGSNPNPTPNGRAFLVPKSNNGVPGTASWETFPWDVTSDPDRANYQAHPHQCILVELSSLDSVTFANRSVYTNMEFGHSSVFQGEPVALSGKLVPLPPGRSKNKFELFVDGKPSVVEDIARLRLLVHGSYHTGKTIAIPTGRTVNDKPEVIVYEIADSIGSFGYLVDHNMTAAERAEYVKLPPAEQLKTWRIDLGLPAPRVAGSTRYAVELAPNETFQVKPRIQAFGATGPSCAGCPRISFGSLGVVMAAVMLGPVGMRRRRRRD